MGGVGVGYLLAFGMMLDYNTILRMALRSYTRANYEIVRLIETDERALYIKIA